MKSIPLKFKKLGNHWYLDINHNDPSDLVMDPKIEKYLSYFDTWNEGQVDSIYLTEQNGFIIEEGLLQFDDNDLMRYFTTKDSFDMHFYIENRPFIISSKLYFLLEQTFKFDFHEVIYRVSIL